MKAFVS